MLIILYEKTVIMNTLASLPNTPVPISLAPHLINVLPACVPAGFPSPAEDHAVNRVDLMAQLIKHPAATFLLRVRGDSMKDAGIFDKDVILVDRAITPRSGHVVVAMIDGEFACKTLFLRNDRMKLKSANVTYPDIIPAVGQQVEIWGVVLASIKQFAA